MTVIRDANKSDANALSEFAKLCFIDTFAHLYSKENLLKHLQKTCSPAYFSEALLHDKILLAEDNALIGYIKFGEISLPIDSIPCGSKEIHRLYVHPEFKGQGIGRDLMRQAFDHSVLKASKHVYLSVYEDNTHAQKFYQNHGFSIIGEYDYYVGSHIDREFIMHKKIPTRKYITP